MQISGTWLDLFTWKLEFFSDLYSPFILALGVFLQDNLL